MPDFEAVRLTHEFTADAVISRWHGVNPYFLLVRHHYRYEDVDDEEGRHTKVAKSDSRLIDLDERQWATKHVDVMRVPGAWMLCSKKLSEEKGTLVPILIIQVEEGEQPFYARRHIGILGMGGQPTPEGVSHGIGVKTREGYEDGVFILPNGSITTAQDVYWVGDKMNKGQL